MKKIAEKSIVVDDEGTPLFEIQLACELCGRPINANPDYVINERYHCIYCYNAIKRNDKRYINFHLKKNIKDEIKSTLARESYRNERMEFREIEEIRNRLGLTTRAFAELIGIKVNTYYSYRNARNPSGAVEKILRLLKKEPEEMLQKMRKV